MKNTKSTILQIEKQEVAKSKKKFDHFTCHGWQLEGNESEKGGKKRQELTRNQGP